MAEGQKVSSELLERIIRKSAKRLVILGIENEHDLLEMIHRKAAASQDSGKSELVVTFNHRIKVNFTKGTQTDTLGGTMHVKLEIEGEIDDPDQTELGFEDEDEDEPPSLTS